MFIVKETNNRRNGVEQRQITMLTKQFKRAFDEDRLNALGRKVRFCRRERTVTPFRLAVAMLESLGNGTTRYLADIQRTFNAVCESNVQYKPFHNQLAKRTFPEFMRLLLCQLFNDLTCEVLRFDEHSPFSRFEHIRIQDGSSFAVKDDLKEHFPGRFTTVSPAAVELHVDLDLLSEIPNCVTLSADSEGERHFLPDAKDVTGGLLLADRGYFSLAQQRELDDAGAHFIVRAKSNINPLIIKASTCERSRLKQVENCQLRSVFKKLKRYGVVDMWVQFKVGNQHWKCRLVMHNLTKAGAVHTRYLITNLDTDEFTAQHISDAYRLRWQIELLFKEWKSYANLRAFDTANEHIAQGLIWASLCAATLKRYFAHMTECVFKKPISTHIVAKCINAVLPDVFWALMHKPTALNFKLRRALKFLADNAKRAKHKRDKLTGRLKLGLHHVYAPS